MDASTTIFTVIGAALSALLAVFLFGPLYAWIKRKIQLGRGVVIASVVEKGPTTWEYGFSEPGIKVTFSNASGVAIGLKDIRLSFNKNYGLPVHSEAPPPRSHPTLPTTVETGSSAIWYFPAEQASRSLRSLVSPRVLQHGKVRVRVVVTEDNGKVYRGPAFDLSLDHNSHWRL